MSRSILILPFGNMRITIMSWSVSMLVSCVSGLEFVSCLRIDKKLSLGRENAHVIPASLLLFSSILYLDKCIIA